jgi:predicted MPP superfamily phosphohydrolase
VTQSSFIRNSTSSFVTREEITGYANRGIGVIAPPIRFNCRPEVTLITLV